MQNLVNSSAHLRGLSVCGLVKLLATVLKY
jgi:hypothetical protein